MRGLPSQDLPLTRNLNSELRSNSIMPLERPIKKDPKNLTGVYLGVIKNSSSSDFRPRGNVPPLARGRGMPVRAKTPTEQRRHRYVELLRVKEEKQGFVGAPPKTASKNTEESDNSWNRTRSQPQQEIHEQPVYYSPEHEAEVMFLTRQTPRQYTAANNTGVNHLEKLEYSTEVAPAPGLNDLLSLWPDGVRGEIQRMSSAPHLTPGITDSFINVCKGRSDTLQTLLPSRRSVERSISSLVKPTYSTGFVVKSYRNPQRAELLAEFNDENPQTIPSDRPRTVALSRRLLVPNPYFARPQTNPPKRSKTTILPAINGRQDNPGSGLLGSLPDAGSLSKTLFPLKRLPNEHSSSPQQTPRLSQGIAEEAEDSQEKDRSSEPDNPIGENTANSEVGSSTGSAEMVSVQPLSTDGEILMRVNTADGEERQLVIDADDNKSNREESDRRRSSEAAVELAKDLAPDEQAV